MPDDRLTALACALAAADPQGAATLCASFLESVDTGGPEIGWWTLRVGDARIWAISAPAPEVAAHTIAGLEVLRASALPRGILKQTLVAIWGRLAVEDRRGFLARVDPNGTFRGEGAR